MFLPDEPTTPLTPVHEKSSQFRKVISLSPHRVPKKPYIEALIVFSLLFFGVNILISSNYNIHKIIEKDKL